MLAFGRGKKEHFTCAKHIKKRKKPPAIHVFALLAGIACLGYPAFTYGEKGAVPLPDTKDIDTFDYNPLSSYDFEAQNADPASRTICANNTLPQAVIVPEYTGLTDSPITFDGGSSYDKDGEIVAYHWTFGDGTWNDWNTESTIEHSYAEPGTYKVRVWVIDNCAGISPIAQATVTITNPEPCDGGCPDGQFCDEQTNTCVECLENADCDDGLFCNGEETCSSGACQTGTSPCTESQECDEDADECINPAECEADADCDDGLFCNGEETCVDGECQAGTAPCTAEQKCDEDADECVTPTESLIIITPENPGVGESTSFSPQTSAKGSNVFYYWVLSTGRYSYEESFSSQFASQGEYTITLTLYNTSTWEVIDTEERSFTVGEQQEDACGNTCAEDEYCDKDSGECVECLQDSHCDDGLFCNSEKTCVECFQNSHCDDGLFCNGEETCVDGECQAGTDPCSAEQECNEDNDSCENPAECAIDADCDDGLFCNGEETCVDGKCQAGTNPCTAEQECDEDTDACVNPPECEDDADCDDGLFCNGEETCVDGECQAGTNPCTAEQECDEDNDACVNPPECEGDADCDDGLFCNGEETCVDGECFAGENPCLESETCNEDEDVCEEAAVPEELTITYSPEAPSPYQSVTFTAAGGAAEEDNIFYYWSFDDGEYTYSPSFSRSFDEPGDYVVALTIYNASTWQEIETAEAIITVIAPPSVLSLLSEDIGSANGIVFSDNKQTVWVVGGKPGNVGTLAAIDVSDPLAPELIGSENFNGYPWQVTRRGNLIAVAANSGIAFFDVSSPSNPTHLSDFAIPGNPSMIFGAAFVGDNYLYVASELKLNVLEIPDFNSPSPIVRATFNENLKGKIVVHGNRAYVGEIDDPSVLVIDTADPANPVLNSIRTTRRVFDIDINDEGTLLAIVERNASKQEELGGITIYDISNPNILPEMVYQNLDESLKLQYISFGEDALYTNSFSKISKIILTDPEHPFFVPAGIGFGGTYYPASIEAGENDNVFVGLTGAALGIIGSQ